MRTKALLFTTTLLVFVISVFAQDMKASYPFSKGNWSFDLNRIMGIKKTNQFVNGFKHERTETDLNLQGMYFISRGLGIGLNYLTDWTCENPDFYGRTHTIGANIQYGTSIGSNNYIYARIGGRLGWEKNVYVDPGPDNNIEYNYERNSLNVGVGFPFRLQKNGHVYFTPEISWERNSGEFFTRKEVENTFGIGIKLQTYLSPGEFSCGTKKNATSINMHYDRGSQFIDFSSSGFYGLTKNNTIYDIIPVDNKSDISRGELMVNYGYYILNNIAIGAGFGVNTNKSKAGSYESKISGWNFTPQLTFNLPAKNYWNNLFLNLEGGYGSVKFKSNSSPNPYNVKTTTTTYGGGLGFNYFISSQIALTPKIGYTFQKDVTSASLYPVIDSRGPEFRLGFRYVF